MSCYQLEMHLINQNDDADEDKIKPHTHNFTLQGKITETKSFLLLNSWCTFEGTIAFFFFWACEMCVCLLEIQVYAYANPQLLTTAP